MLQQQHLSPVQLQVVKLLEMPLAQLEDNVRSEMDTNPSLEPDYDSQMDGYSSASSTDTPISDSIEADDIERREDALKDALDNMGKDDRTDDDYSIPHASNGDNENGRTMEDANLTSFVDTLIDQMGLEELDDEEKQIMEYLIYSLDDDGLLRKPLVSICDELEIYRYIYVDTNKIEDVLLKLQEFDPAGVGARDLRECLMLQVGRMKATPTTTLMYDVMDKCYDDFISNHWERICRTLHISETQADEIRHEIRRRLNPKPGASFGETQGRSLQQITPDFILNVDFDNNISFEVNNGRVPVLHVVAEDEQFLKEMEGKKLTRADREGVTFIQRNVDTAKVYIEAIRQRTETMTRTMKAIIDLQRPYFLSGDDSDLRPMVLKDIAEKAGYDISTISRVSRAKYVETPWGIFPLRHFFSEGYTTDNGDTMSTREIKNALRDIIKAEDKRQPLSDDKLVSVMKANGYPIARRTIAKYREQLGIPVARLRKQ